MLTLCAIRQNDILELGDGKPVALTETGASIALGTIYKPTKAAQANYNHLIFLPMTCKIRFWIVKNHPFQQSK
jgi:hypothetical protein